MNCKQIHTIIKNADILSLTEKESQQIIAHNEHCSDCNVLYNGIKDSLEYINIDKEEIEHPFFYTRVEQAIKTSKTEKKSIPSLLLKPVLMMMIVGISVFSGISLVNFTTQEISITENELYSDNINQNYFNEMELEFIETDLYQYTP